MSVGETGVAPTGTAKKTATSESTNNSSVISIQGAVAVVYLRIKKS